MTGSRGTDDSVANLRSGLDDLHKYYSKPPSGPNPLEDVKATFESIPATSRAAILKKSIGKGIRRFRVAALMLAECDPAPAVDEWIESSLSESNADRRDWMIQVVGNHDLTRFSHVIARIVDSDPECRWFAVIAAGELGTQDCRVALVKLADSFGDEPIPMALIQALSKYDTADVVPYLQHVFETHSEERDRVFAAWGLGRRRDRNAIDYLVSKLDEPDTTSESRRAAQALSDLYGWDLDWTPEAQGLAKIRWAAQKNPYARQPRPKKEM